MDESPASLEDYENYAKQILPPAQWDWVIGGAEQGRTYRRNLDQFRDFQLSPRVLAGIKATETASRFFAKPIEAPIIAAPVGHMTQFHELGELAVMEACKATGTHCVVSMHTRRSLELLAEQAGEAGWSYQVYLYSDPAVVASQIARAVRLGATSVVLTVDSCHRSPSYQRLRAPWDAREHGSRDEPDLPESRNDRLWTWGMARDLVGATDVPVILKGVQCADDAERAAEIGCAGVWISNHGGRNNETDQALLGELAKVRALVGPTYPLVIDGGFRTGSDAAKALLLGASQIAIGRPLIFGVVVAGAKGTTSVLRIIQDELKRALAAIGVADVLDVPNHADQVGPSRAAFHDEGI
jgi:isopentenyl diphosphate isomerase/L-lactate dehydrogenase-like FMN-dependent dehydrogenase